MEQTREQRLVQTILALTDTLVADYDVADLLQTLVDEAIELFDADAAGILLVDSTGAFRVAASTSDRSRLIGLLQLDAGEGPCVEATTTGLVVAVADVAELQDRWPRFARASAESGFASVHSIPMRLRGTVLGSMNLFREEAGVLDDGDIVAAKALTDIATISILQQRAVEEAVGVQAELQRALDNRMIIEQAKGWLSRHHQVDLPTAFGMLRRYARQTQTKLADVAAAVVREELQL